MNIRKFSSALIATAVVALFSLNAWGEDFIIHEVKSKETIFGIASHYHISSNTLLEYNPQAASGVKKGMKLRIPVDIPSTKVADTQTTKDSAKASNSITNSGFQTNYTVSDALASNIQMSEEPAPTDENINDSLPQTYMAAQGDTFAMISQRTGVSSDTLIELNPFLDPNCLVQGTMVRLTEDAPYYDNAAVPQPAVDPIVSIQDPKDTQELEFDHNFVIDSIPSNNIPEFHNPLEFNNDSVANMPEDIFNDNSNILLMLPFMAQSDNQNRQAKNYADFYRGFLLAAKEYANNAGNDIEVMVTDTENSLSNIREYLSENGDRDLAVIIGPEESSQLQAIIDYATPQGIYVFNVFNFSDENYKTNPLVIQANINQQLMYDKAIDYLLDEYADCIPVILSPENAKEEKAPFVSALRDALSRQGKIAQEITFEETLEVDDVLSQLSPDNNYVFIPKSGAQSVFNRFAPTLIALQDQENGKERYRVFGYPDWIAYRGESLDILQRLNAEIYSRFLSDEKDLENKEIQKKFMQWYGQPMMEAVPSQGLLGYDIGRYLIQGLQRGPLDKKLNSLKASSGLQNSYKFSHADSAEGYINEVLYIIQFLPGDNYKVQQL